MKLCAVLFELFLFGFGVCAILSAFVDDPSGLPRTPGQSIVICLIGLSFIYCAVTRLAELRDDG